jgi:hypothetical protein
MRYFTKAPRQTPAIPKDRDFLFARSPKTVTSAPLPTMMKGTMGPRGAGRMPRRRATQGVKRPMMMPLKIPEEMVERSRKAFTRGPVSIWGKPKACTRSVRAKNIAVWVTKRVSFRRFTAHHQTSR